MLSFIFFPVIILLGASSSELLSDDEDEEDSCLDDLLLCFLLDSLCDLCDLGDFLCFYCKKNLKICCSLIAYLNLSLFFLPFSRVAMTVR